VLQVEQRFTHRLVNPLQSGEVNNRVNPLLLHDRRQPFDRPGSTQAELMARVAGNSGAPTILKVIDDHGGVASLLK
jgi:hypothetical protein